MRLSGPRCCRTRALLISCLFPEPGWQGRSLLEHRVLPAFKLRLDVRDRRLQLAVPATVSGHRVERNLDVRRHALVRRCFVLS